MASKVEIMVNGKPLQVNKNVPLLQGLQEEGVFIPSLCFNPVLAGNGSCGLCIVEVFDQNNSHLQHSCLLYPRQGLQIETETTRIKQVRSQAAQLLLSRGPFPKQAVNKLVSALVQEEKRNRNTVTDETITNSFTGCILCGLCVRICQKIGRNRLTFVGRGKKIQVEFVSDKEGSCGSCHACSRICPTGYIAPNPQQAFPPKLYKCSGSCSLNHNLRKEGCSMCFRPPTAAKKVNKCKECQAVNPPTATVCSKCGAELPKLPPPPGVSSSQNKPPTK